MVILLLSGVTYLITTYTSIMETAVKKRLINVEEYYRMGETGLIQSHENVELINGEIYTMSPIGSRHAAIVDQLADLLKSKLPLKTITRTQNPIHIDQWNEPEPDIALVHFREDYYASAHPTATGVLLVVEVSGSSVDFDRTIKLSLYASAAIPVYWIIDWQKNVIEVMEIPVKDQYTRHSKYHPGDKITFMDIDFDVASILLTKFQ